MSRIRRRRAGDDDETAGGIRAVACIGFVRLGFGGWVVDSFGGVVSVDGRRIEIKGQRQPSIPK
jgi:hypothetical protein